jgi:hypothetical protein
MVRGRNNSGPIEVGGEAEVDTEGVGVAKGTEVVGGAEGVDVAAVDAGKNLPSAWADTHLR